MSNRSAFPRLETPRLFLREIAERDLPIIAILANDRDIAGNTLNIPYPYSEADAIAWRILAQQGFRLGSAFTFAIELKQTQTFIGSIGVQVERRFDRAEVGYWLSKAYWNQGLVTEALAEILRFGFQELTLNKVFATHLAHNVASGRVMLKNGMLKEGELVQHVKRDEQYYDLWQYRLTRQEYEQFNKVRSINH
jgi:ribosomal-protein-alanine N-acetyltransferase